MAMTRENNGLRWVGTSPVRPDGTDKVTGRAKFGADLMLPGMLIGKVLRSPYPHAIIKSIDISKAEALPGVKAVITSDDVVELPSEWVPAGELQLNFHDLQRNIMAKGKVLYDGHAVAAVAATSTIVDSLAMLLLRRAMLPTALHASRHASIPTYLQAIETAIGAATATTTTCTHAHTRACMHA